MVRFIPAVIDFCHTRFVVLSYSSISLALSVSHFPCLPDRILHGRTITHVSNGKAKAYFSFSIGHAQWCVPKPLLRSVYPR